MSETMLTANGVTLCVETFGGPADPAILLIHGAQSSMLWWEDELCALLAAGGRYVIRFDNRDTGRSVSYPPGEPPYAMSDLARDAVGILDALGIPRAHVVGRSMSGGTALHLGVDHAERVASLTFLTTTTGDDDLPGMEEEFVGGAGEPPLDDTTALVDYVVEEMRACAGRSAYFDEAATRAIAEHDVARTTTMASALGNHFAMRFDGPTKGGYADLTMPALVVHGELDPFFPLAHGEALAAAIPGAELLVMAGVGHDVPRPIWPVFVDALLRHTDRASSRS
jgi:pimeloyl-ACP methyl ester carboxylesterase